MPLRCENNDVNWLIFIKCCNGLAPGIGMWRLKCPKVRGRGCIEKIAFCWSCSWVGMAEVDWHGLAAGLVAGISFATSTPPSTLPSRQIPNPISKVRIDSGPTFPTCLIFRTQFVTPPFIFAIIAARIDLKQMLLLAWRHKFFMVILFFVYFWQTNGRIEICQRQRFAKRHYCLFVKENLISLTLVWILCRPDLPFTRYCTFYQFAFLGQITLRLHNIIACFSPDRLLQGS